MSDTLIYCWEFYINSTGEEVTYYTYTSDSQMARDQVTLDEGSTDWSLDSTFTLPEKDVLQCYGKGMILDAD